MSILLPAAEGKPAHTVRSSILIFETPMSRLTGPLSTVVDNNPSAFAEAYWEINSLRVYTLQQPW
jgi:hypothetical protein